MDESGVPMVLFGLLPHPWVWQQENVDGQLDLIDENVLVASAYPYMRVHLNQPNETLLAELAESMWQMADYLERMSKDMRAAADAVPVQ